MAYRISSNGVDWVPLGPIGTLPVPLQDITFGDGSYYGVTQTPADFPPGQFIGWSAASTNLKDWDVRQNDGLRGGATITYGKGLFVAHTAPKYPPGTFATYTLYSTNGLLWQTGTSTSDLSSRDSYMGEIYYENSLFFVVHQGGASSGTTPESAYILSYSEDGITFTNSLCLSVRAGSGLGLKSAAAGEYYVYPAGNSIYYTTNLTPAPRIIGFPVVSHLSTNWTRVPLDVTNARTADIAFGNETFVVLTAGRIFKSNPVSGSAPARIVKQPVSLSLNVGGTASFSVLAHGTDPITYQWRKDGTNIVGATNSTLTLPDVTIASAGEYDVQVTNPSVTVLSAKASLRVSFADIKRYSGVTLRAMSATSFSLSIRMSWTKPTSGRPRRISLSPPRNLSGLISRQRRNPIGFIALLFRRSSPGPMPK